MKLYKSCTTLPIYNFFKIVETVDYRHLIKNYDEENETIKLSASSQAEFETIFKSILYEYCDLTQNFKLKTLYKKKIILAELEGKCLFCSNILDIFMEYDYAEILLLLEELGIKIDMKANLKEQVLLVVSVITGLKNKIGVLKANILEKEKSKNKPNFNNGVSLIKEALYLEKKLDLKYSIDIMTTSVTKWVSMVNIKQQ